MNRSHALVAALALALALPVAAQTATDPKLTPLPPPPGLNDPGVKAGEPDRSGQKPIERPVPYDQSQEGSRSTPATTDAQGGNPNAAIALPSMQDNGAVDARGQAAPVVTVRQQGDDQIQEYRTAGKLTMIVVTPKNGVPQTYMADQDGKLIRDPRNGPVKPVMYKVYEWGAAPKPVDSN